MPGTPIIYEAQWMRPPGVDRDVGRAWRALACLRSSWFVELQDVAVASEQDLHREVAAATAPFTGGVVGVVALVGDGAWAKIALVTERDRELPIWVPSTMRLEVALEGTEEGAGRALVREVSAELGAGWSCVGAPDVVRRHGGLGMGQPSVGWANYVSADEYELEDLEELLAGTDTVSVERTPQGALAWVSDVRWDPDNVRARTALDSIARVWRARFSVARSAQAAADRYNGSV